MEDEVASGRQITVRLRAVEADRFERARSVVSPRFPGLVSDADLVRVMLDWFLATYDERVA